MQIVIEISEKDYKDICESAELLGDRNINYWERKVAKGTPLPKVLEDFMTEIETEYKDCEPMQGYDAWWNGRKDGLSDALEIIDKYISGK